MDRHCDTVENDISTLTPVPLYCGLAGTMAGVILGLGSLLFTGSITDLLSSGSGSFGAAADGINDLLFGVAWAMVASIFGIIFTTWGSILFKHCKLEGETGKNTFLAWLQSKLLPELPSDTSDALKKLVKNLNKFNDTFKDNTSELRGALTQVNESYRIQGDIIKAVHDMDVMKMAKANIRVLQELKECTDKLEIFNQYLNDIEGYTDAIYNFTTQFEQEAKRLCVLEEIRNFFTRHKAEIAHETADVDAALKDSLKLLNESTESNVNELNKVFVQQAQTFKDILTDEKNSFEQLNREMRSLFSEQLSQMPMLERRLSEIANIPSKLDHLIERMESSNNNLVSRVNETMTKAAKQISSVSPQGTAVLKIDSFFSKRMRWVLLLSVFLIVMASVANAIHNIWFTPCLKSEPIIEKVDDSLLMDDSLSAVKTPSDSVSIKDTTGNKGLVSRTVYEKK